MLLMVEERKKKSYLKYWDVNDLYSWARTRISSK